MKRYVPIALAASFFLLSSCGSTPSSSAASQSPAVTTSPAEEVSISPVPESVPTTSVPLPSSAPGSEIDRDTALSLALVHVGVPETDAYNIKVERDGDHGIAIYDIEFETDYGDYDFELSVQDGRIVGADYEVGEEWLDVLGGNAVDLEEAKAILQEKVPRVPSDEIQIWEENEDGRSRYEGQFYFDGMDYEFELDPQTGIIFDWNADLLD